MIHMISVSFILAGAAGAALADVVVLRNGGRIEGAASVVGDKVEIRLEFGPSGISLPYFRVATRLRISR